MTFLYHICCESDMGNFEKGYIGVTDNFEQRINRHLMGHSGSPILKRAIHKYKDLICFSIIAEGCREQMLYVESLLRPSPQGWNAVAGGGLPPNMSGKIMSQNQKDNIGKSNRISMQKRFGNVWNCDGLEFLSKLEAAEHFGVSRKTVKDRCDNPNFKNWFRGKYKWNSNTKDTD